MPWQQRCGVSIPAFGNQAGFLDAASAFIRVHRRLMDCFERLWVKSAQSVLAADKRR